MTLQREVHDGITLNLDVGASLLSLPLSEKFYIQAPNTSIRGSRLSEFHDTLLKGNIFKEIVRVLLEKSDYIVIPYGYENAFANIRNTLTHSVSETARRIRSSPDLLVYDDNTKDVKLVEVKMSSHPFPQLNKKGLIGTYQKYWNDAIMVLVLPVDNVFYAQEIADLGKKEQYDPKTDFRRIQEIFTRVNAEDLERYKTIARRLIDSMKAD